MDSNSNKKSSKNKPTSKKYTKYKLDGDKLTRDKSCPRCGPGTFLAKGSGRLYCGKCHFVEMIQIPHEKVLALAPHNTLFHVFGELTHPGDSLQFSETKEILALPIQAPWGSMVASLEKAAQLKPVEALRYE